MSVSSASAIRASLLPHSRYTVLRPTPALAATDSMVNPPYPDSANSASAAWRITRRDRSIRGSTKFAARPWRPTTLVCLDFLRYLVDDIDSAVDFYTRQLAFDERMRPGPGFAMLQRGPLRLLLNTPAGGGGAGQQLPDGSQPEPGGWNRFQIEVDDLDPITADLRRAGATFRSEIITGRGGRQILLEDPAGNLIELFEPGPG